MEDNKVLQEIENAILEENKTEVKADLQTTYDDNVLPSYLEKNTVTLPLSEYIALYENSKELNNLVWLILYNSELDYNNEFLDIKPCSGKNIANEVRRIAPEKYFDTFEALLKATCTEQ